MDEIKRKLELIDRQSARGRLHTRVISTCPLVFVAVGLCAGVLVQSNLGLSVEMWSALLVLSGAATALFFAVQQLSGRNCRYVTAYLAMACFVCLGAIRLTGYGRPAPNDVRDLVIEERRLATIRGLVATEPYTNRYRDWKFAKFRPADSGTSFYLKIDQVETAAGWRPATGTIRMQVGETVTDLQAGDRIEAYCWLDRFRPPTNPGQFNTARHMARRNVFIAAFVRSRAAIEILENPPAGILARLRAKASQAAAKALLGDMDEQDAGRGLLQALLLGDRREIASDTYAAFRKTGLLHFISLSGMHMGILLGLIWRSCRTAGLMKPARAAVCAIAVAVFLLVVPPRAPTVRAAVICWVFCASIMFRRHSNPINTLSLAAVILLLIRPTQLFEAGWQLSFACVLAIILFTERIEAFIREQARRTGLRLRVFDITGPVMTKLFAAGLAALLGGAGILLYHFYAITLLTSIWTVLVFPLVVGILGLGFLKVIFFYVVPPLSSLLGVAVGPLSSLLILAVRLIAKLDISQILIGRVSVVAIIAYYCAVVFAGYANFRRPAIKRVICAAMFVSLVVYLGVLKYQRTYRDDLVVTCLDVGHGQAILVRLPGGTDILFDAGSLHGTNIGARIVTPFLDYQGIGGIDAVVVSHNDTDHINGVPEIVASRNVGGVYANDAFFGKTDEWGTIGFLRKCLAARDLEIEELDDCIRSGGASIKTLWPCEGFPDTNDLSDNNRSLVSLIEFAGVGILLCSDIEQFAQVELLRRRPDLKADVVVVPHHGSTRTLDPAFLDSLDADVLICSCDRKQFERTVSGTGPLINASNGTKVFYTARDGAVTVTVGRDGSIRTEPQVKERPVFNSQY